MEGICFSFNSFVTKFNNAVGAAGLALGLIVVGYVQPEVSGEYLPQSQFTVNGLYAMVTLIPAIGFLLSLIPMAFYDYTGARKERILAELAERRAEKAQTAEPDCGGEDAPCVVTEESRDAAAGRSETFGGETDCFDARCSSTTDNAADGQGAA